MLKKRRAKTNRHQGSGDSGSGERKVHRRKRRFILPFALVACCLGTFAGGWEARALTLQASGSVLSALDLSVISKVSGMSTQLHQETVDVFGGSMAHGWLDPSHDSYLRRAFATRSGGTNVDYKYVDHTVVGETPVILSTQHEAQYKEWLRTDKPQVVVLSWGLLNSMSSRHKTTIQKFGAAIHQEISDALAVKAVVLVVTPPVTQESATTDHQLQEKFIEKLEQEAGSFRSRNIFIFDVYHQMEAYLAAHSQTYEDYYGNSWHPNQAGHELAGMLLANDLMEKFGYHKIVWK